MAGCIRVLLAFGREAVLFVTHFVKTYCRRGRIGDTKSSYVVVYRCRPSGCRGLNDRGTYIGRLN